LIFVLYHKENSCNSS